MSRERVTDQKKKVSFAAANRPTSTHSSRSATIEVPAPQPAKNTELKKRVKKSHSVEKKEAKHDLTTALRVAMRNMLDEAVQLTEQNMRDNKKEMKAIADKKKSKSQVKYEKTLERQRKVAAKHAAAAAAAAENENNSNFSKTLPNSFRNMTPNRQTAAGANQTQTSSAEKSKSGSFKKERHHSN